MKTESIEEWKLRTKKEVKSYDHSAAYKKVYSHGWVTKNKKGVVIKKKDTTKRY